MRSLLVLLAVAAAALGARHTAEDCVVGDSWVIDNVRFNCTVKGDYKYARGVGCVPSNRDNGTTLSTDGATFEDTLFRYKCEKHNRTVYWTIINCFDWAHAELAIGSERVNEKSGAVYRCTRRDNHDGEKNVARSVESDTACYHKNGTEMQLGDMWQETELSKADVDGKLVELGKAREMVCIYDSKRDKVLVKTQGCITMNGTLVFLGFFGEVGGHVVKCVDWGRLVVIPKEEMMCEYHGEKYPHNKEYKTPDGKAQYSCRFGKITKDGCFVDGTFFAYGETIYGKDGHAYFCHSKPGYHDFGDLKGCTHENGTVFKFKDTWLDGGDKMMMCTHEISEDGKIVKAKIIQTACKYENRLIGLDQSISWGKGAAVWCGYNETLGLYIPDLYTAEEMEEFRNSKRLEVIGQDGLGTGNRVTWTTTTTTTTTTPPPTTVAPKTTPKPKPTTTAAPKTTTTTTPKPTTTTTTTTAAPKAIEKPCVDLLPSAECARLAPVCTAKADSLVDELKGLLGTHKNASKVLDAVAKVTGQKKETKLDDFWTAIAGNDRLCDRCSSVRSGVRDMAIALCPKTCGKCAGGATLEDLIDGMTKFYGAACN